MKHPAAWVAFATGIIVSMVAWLLLGSLNTEAREERFREECALLNHRMQSQLDQQMRILRELVASLSSYADVVRDVFELTVSVPGKSQPGIMSIGYATLVGQEELPRFVDYVRGSAHPGFFIRPEGLRARYLPVTYVVPHAGSDSLLGLDLLTVLPSGVESDAEPSSFTVSISGLAISKLTGGDIIVTRFVEGGSSAPEARGACFLLLDTRAVLTSGLTYAYDSSRISFSVGWGGGGRDVVFAPSTMQGAGMRHRDSLLLGTAVWRVDYQASESAFEPLHHDVAIIVFLIGVFLSGIIFILIRKTEGRRRAHAP